MRHARMLHESNFASRRLIMSSPPAAHGRCSAAGSWLQCMSTLPGTAPGAAAHTGCHVQWAAMASSIHAPLLDPGSGGDIRLSRVVSRNIQQPDAAVAGDAEIGSGGHTAEEQHRAAPFWAVFFAARVRRRTQQRLSGGADEDRLMRRVSNRFIEVFPPMTHEQTMRLSPWEKYRDFNRFPFKFVLQMLLLLLVSAQTWFYASAVLPYFYHSSAAFETNFYGFTDAAGNYRSAITAQPGSRGLSDMVLISTIPEFTSSIESVYRTYETYLNTSIDGYAPPKPSLPITVFGTVRCGPALHQATDNGGGSTPAAEAAAERLCGDTFTLVATAPLGPFSGVDLSVWRLFFDRVERITLQWSLVDLSVDFLSHYGLAAFDVEWTLSAEYDFQSAGQMSIVYSSSCTAPHGAATSNSMGLGMGNVDYKKPVPLANLAQVAVATILAILCIKSLLISSCPRCCECCAGHNSAHGEQSDDIHRLSLSPTDSASTAPAESADWSGEMQTDGEDFAIIARRNSRNWLAMILLQCGVNIAASITQVNPLQAAFFFSDPLLGASVGLTWLNLMRCFEYTPRYYILIHTLTHSLPSVGRFILGCVPLFLSFVGAATVFFGRQAQSFGSLGETITTLFSLLNGDTMLDTFDAVGSSKNQLGGGLGRLFLAVFIMLFTYAVLNVFIAILCQAWEEVQYETAQWRAKLQSEDETPPPQSLQCE
eukprot:COSAG05_NODE_207_length_14113_cov_13.452119_7_plen_708_part_00